MGKFLCGVVLGASVMGVSVWAIEVSLDAIPIQTTSVVMAECMYNKDGVWYPVTHVTIDQSK